MTRCRAKALSLATPQALRVHNNHNERVAATLAAAAIRNNVAHSRRARYSAKAIM